MPCWKRLAIIFVRIVITSYSIHYTKLYEVPKFSTITNNTLIYSLTGVSIGFGGCSGGYSSLDGTPISFINQQNTIGHTATNSNNILISSNSNAYSFKIGNLTSFVTLDQCNIIGYDLPNKVKIARVSNVVVRENSITNANSHPISLTNEANQSIHSPTLTGLTHLET